jgi:predicted nucleotidyltransferase
VALAALSPVENACLERYLQLLSELPGVEVWLFGSVARGDVWAASLPMHSDIDLLVLTGEPVAEERRQELLDATYPLFLECGRQLSPQFRTHAEFARPAEARAATFRENVLADGVLLWPPQGPRRE